jgi:hypothetical protein
MLLAIRFRVFAALLALEITAAMACSGNAMRSGGKDAAQANGRDTADDHAVGGDDGRDAGATIDGRWQDTDASAPDSDASRPGEDAAREASPEGRADGSSLADRETDARPAVDRVEAASSDGGKDVLLVVRDAAQSLDASPDTRAVDSIPTLQFLAGGLGGPGSADGTGKDARFCLPRGMASDGQGNVYIADFCNFAVRSLAVATGAVTTVAGVMQEGGWTDGARADARFSPPAGVAPDGQGNLFVTDFGTGLIRKVVLATGSVTTLAGSVDGPSGSVDGVGSLAGFDGPWGIVHDGRDTLYISEAAGSTIRKVVLTTGAVTTIAGSAAEPGFRDGTLASARLSGPQGIVLDGTDALLIADTGNRAIRRLILATGELTTVDKLSFPHPAGLANDGKGNLYVVDDSDMSLQRLVLATGEVFPVAGGSRECGADNGTAATARFCQPSGVVLDGAGNALIADSINQVIRKVELATRAVTTVAGAARQAGAADGSGAQAGFDFQNWNAGLASDGQGNLFVADPNNDAIRKIVVATAEVTTFAGSLQERGMVDGVGKDARFALPTSLVFDGSGSLYIADTSNHAIRKLALATAEVSTVAGARKQSGSADGDVTAATFNRPEGLALDFAGNLYVADTGNNTVRQISLASGLVTTLAGVAGQPGSDDGIGKLARFNGPVPLVFDGTGALLVGDRDGNTVRRIALNTSNVTTIAGSPGEQGSEDGIGSGARFTLISGMAFDGIGSLYVAEVGNQSVRKVALDSGSVTTVVGSPHRQGVVPGPLPASLGGPIGLLFVAPATLFITDVENAVLRAQF